MFKRLFLSLLFTVSVLYATVPNEESITKLYIATFDRAPDAAGLDYWLKSGLSLEEMASNFFEQVETKERYPKALTNADFIIEVYSNLFGRSPDTDGFEYWLKELEDGKISRSLFLLAVISSAQGDDAKILENKTKVGIEFAKDGHNDIEKAHEILKDVTADPDSVNKSLCEFGLSGCDVPPEPGPPAPTPPVNPFIITVQTDISGMSLDTQFVIPTIGTGYNYQVDCNNDGIYEAMGQIGDYPCTYTIAGTYTIAIRGNFPRIHFNGVTDKKKLLSIDQWGTQKWDTMSQAFQGCINLEGQANDIPDLTNLTDISSMFRQATKFNQDISNWDTSKVENMSYIFYSAEKFNQDISDWNISNVTDMSHMFYSAEKFNQDISDWNISNVTDMSHMFYSAEKFNQDISDWNTSNVTNMSYMFHAAKEFNQDISSWDTSKVGTMRLMFDRAEKFNQDISNWDMSNVGNLSLMFNEAQMFDQNISDWNTSNVTNMSYMFHNATNFHDQNLSKWNIGNVSNHTNFCTGWGTGNTPPGGWTCP